MILPSHVALSVIMTYNRGEFVNSQGSIDLIPQCFPIFLTSNFRQLLVNRKTCRPAGAFDMWHTKSAYLPQSALIVDSVIPYTLSIGAVRKPNHRCQFRDFSWYFVTASLQMPPLRWLGSVRLCFSTEIPSLRDSRGV